MYITYQCRATSTVTTCLSIVELVFTHVAIGLPEDVLKPPDLNCGVSVHTCSYWAP